jgi:hypothetical protein
LAFDNTVITDLTPPARHAARRHSPDPEEHHQGPGYSPRHEEPQNHRHRMEKSLAGGGILAALRQGRVQGVAWRLLPVVVFAAASEKGRPRPCLDGLARLGPSLGDLRPQAGHRRGGCFRWSVAIHRHRS